MCQEVSRTGTPSLGVCAAFGHWTPIWRPFRPHDFAHPAFWALRLRGLRKNLFSFWIKKCYPSLTNGHTPSKFPFRYLNSVIRHSKVAPPPGQF